MYFFTDRELFTLFIKPMKKTLAIKIGCDVNLYIPNSFTPNGDYDNEMLVYRGDNIIDFDFSIFNRWGELMFQTNNLSEF